MIQLKHIFLKSLLINTGVIFIGTLFTGQIYSVYRQSRPLFVVNKDTITSDLKQAKNSSHEKTGWPSKKFAYDNLDKDGFRKYLEYPTNPCIEVYGGSYAYSFNSESQEESWSASLGKDLKCSVLNYGVPGFGSDQAVIRHNKYASGKNLAVLMFVDASLKRNMLPMLSLSYDGISKSYNKKTFKPKFKIDGDALTIENPNSQTIYNHILEERKKICLGPTSLLCVAKRVFNNINNSIISKGNLYQNIATLSPYLANNLIPEIEYKSDLFSNENIKMHLFIINRFLDNCKDINQKCLVSRFPYMLDIAYPERVTMNPVEIVMKEKYNSIYISSYKTAVCMRSKLGVPIKGKKIDRGVMRFEHPQNKHYLSLANQAFSNCLYVELKDRNSL